MPPVVTLPLVTDIRPGSALRPATATMPAELSPVVLTTPLLIEIEPAKLLIGVTRASMPPAPLPWVATVWLTMVTLPSCEKAAMPVAPAPEVWTEPL